MLCVASEAGKKILPSDLRIGDSFVDILTKDLLEFFYLLELKLKLDDPTVDSAVALGLEDPLEVHFSFGQKIILERAVLLPCVFSEGNKPS